MSIIYFPTRIKIPLLL